MSGLYSLRRADFSVRLAAVLFMLVLGYAYSFAFLMVKEWAGLTPEQGAATYVPATDMEDIVLLEESQATTEALDFSSMEEMRHQVDTGLLIQDSHIHIMIYAIVAALQTLLILGLGWGAAWRNTVITAAFGSGALDFSGQWLVKAGIPGFSWLTIASGWLMSAVYVVVLVGTLRAVLGRERE